MLGPGLCQRACVCWRCFAAAGSEHGEFGTGRRPASTASPCTASRRCGPGQRLRYVNPAAPKGGRITHGVVGTFDSLNPFIVKGLAPTQIRGYVIESLMARGYDEPFTLYGLLARSVETDAERSYVTFELDPAAKFSDGKPVTAADVIFSWEILRDKGRPNFRTYYAKVAKAEALSERTVRFDLTGADDRELPLILGLMPVLAKHAIDPATFEDTTLEPIVGSGPYVIADVRAGDSVTLKRNPNYWGRDLPINRGFWNFDEVRTDFYRDANAQFEAFKKGLFDVRAEHDPGTLGDRLRRARGARRPHRQGAVPDRNAQGHVGTDLQHAAADLCRHPRARGDRAAVRFRMGESQFLLRSLQAHRELFRRLGARLPRPSGRRARARPARAVPEGRARRRAGRHLGAAGHRRLRPRPRHAQARARPVRGRRFRTRQDRAARQQTKKPFVFEFLVTTKEQERLAIAFARHLKRAGITMRVRIVDAVQYDRRRISYDFDMIEYRWDQSLSPGNEQAFYWGSAAADEQGTRNYMGVKSPGDRRDDRRAAQGARARATSSPRCARSIAC